MLIDAHAHLNFQAYDEDRKNVINHCQNMKVINIGSQYSTSRLALELAQKNENMFASVGLHPIHVGGQEHDGTSAEAFLSTEVLTKEEAKAVKNETSEKVKMTDKEQLVKIRELLESDASDQIVAVGETGLDYYRLGMRDESSVIKDAQEKMFIKHIALAREFDKPLMLHCRGSKSEPEEAYNNILKILMTNDLPAGRQGSSIITNTPGMIHCFGSNVAIAKHFLNLGFYVGFTGIITFPNAGELIDVVKEIPLNRILTETDSPYLAPQPVRGERNEPMNVKYVAEEIAEIKEISYDEVIAAVERNAKKLFGI